MKINFIRVSYLVAFLLIMPSCTEEKEEKKPEVEEEILDANSSLNTNFNGKVFSIPSPLQTALLIKNLKVPFNESLPNSTENVDKYTTEYEQALNLGIYGTDLGYVSLYEQNSASLKYLATVEKLTNKLGLEGAFDRDFMTRFENNATTEDSMLRIVSEAFRKADDFLKSSNRKPTSALILTGGWIESLYFACELNRTKQSDAIVERIGEQQQTLNSIIEILREFNNNGSNDELIADMEDLQFYFNDISVDYEFVEPKTDSDKKLTTLNHKISIHIDTNTLNQITLKINSIRDKITG